MTYNFDISKKPPTRKQIEEYRSTAFQELGALTDQRNKIKRFELIVMAFTATSLIVLFMIAAYFLEVKVKSFSTTEVFLLVVTVLLFWALKIFAVLEWFMRLLNTLLQELLMHTETKTIQQKENLDLKISQLKQSFEYLSFISQERNKQIFESLSEYDRGFSYLKSVKRMRRSLTKGEEMLLKDRKLG